jgi:tight adherence protein C
MTALMSGIALFGAMAIFGVFIYSLKPRRLLDRLIPNEPSVGLLRQSVQFFSYKLQSLLEPKKRNQQVLFELPDFLELLSVSLSSGESIYASLKRVVPRVGGLLGKELSATLRAIDFGSDIESELNSLARRVPQQQLIETCNKVSISLRRGTPLALMLAQQSDSVKQEVINLLTKRAGKNETRMLIPLVFLILPVTVLFAIFPSLQLLNINYL